MAIQKACKLGKIVRELEDPYYTALQNLLADHDGISDEQLRLLLIRAGLDASYSTVYRHRRQFCKCKD